jgi:hypothetical protein
MKKTVILKFAILFLSIAFVLPIQATIPSIAGTKIEYKMEDTFTRVQKIMNRLAIIKDMDKSEMSNSERKQIRKEVRHLKKEMKTNLNSGVYISVGAIIIIILLLIILL